MRDKPGPDTREPVLHLSPPDADLQLSKSPLLLLSLSLNRIESWRQAGALIEDLPLLVLTEDDSIESLIQGARPYPKSQPPKGKDKATSAESNQSPRGTVSFFFVLHA